MQRPRGSRLQVFLGQACRLLTSAGSLARLGAVKTTHEAPDMRFLHLAFFVALSAAFGCQSLSSKSLSSSDKAPSYQPRVREYFVAAEAVSWNYAPTGKNVIQPDADLGVWGKPLVYEKLRYIEYTDASFSQKKPQDPHLGILGPAIRAVVGDTIKIHFINRTQQPVNMHPHGVLYDKDNEGAHYGGQVSKGQHIMPGEKYTYTWEVPPRAGPGPRDGSSVIWMYHSHDHSGEGIYKGLIGPMVVVDPRFATADAKPNDVDRELFNLFMIFNENKEGQEEEKHLKHTINGLIFGNLPGLTMQEGQRVRWYLIGMGNEVDLHTPHWHGETVLWQGLRKDVVELLPATLITVDMDALNVGTWMYHCHVVDHVHAGMSALYTIEPKAKAPPK